VLDLLLAGTNDRLKLHSVATNRHITLLQRKEEIKDLPHKIEINAQIVGLFISHC
jgi:hypothetical protein